MDYLVSLLVGLAVGLAYAAFGVRSPAPPLIALAGLLGMVMGEQAGVALKSRWLGPAPAPTHAESLMID